MNAPTTIAQISERCFAKDIEQMAQCLVRGAEEAGIDLADGRLVDEWLHAAMYSPGQILAFGEQATERARAKLQVRAGIDTVACTAGLIMGGVAVWLFLIGFTGPADAAILSPAGVEAGGDALMLVGGVFFGSMLGWFIGWLQYAKRIRIVAPDPDDAYTMEQNARRGM